MPIASSFEVTIAEDKTSPVTVKLQNNSYGADEYEWTFEGGVPASSRDRAPESVTFTEAGEHKIRLRVWNAVDEHISEQVIRVDSAIFLPSMRTQRASAPRRPPLQVGQVVLPLK